MARISPSPSNRLIRFVEPMRINSICYKSEKVNRFLGKIVNEGGQTIFSKTKNTPPMGCFGAEKKKIVAMQQSVVANSFGIKSGVS